MDVYTASVDNVALAAATAKTVLQVATPATLRAVVREMQVSFDGVTASAVPGLVELLLQTTAGTASANTPAPHDAAAPASLVTASQNATVEPTAGTVIRRFRISPYGGLLIARFDGLDGMEPIRLPVSGRLGLRCTFAAIVNVNASLTFEA